jgi:membrane protease YdiL (CAAX protease family)
MPALDTLRLLLPVAVALALLLTTSVAALVHLASQRQACATPWKILLVQFAAASPWRWADLLFVLLLIAMGQLIRHSFPVSIGWDVLAFQGVLIAGILWRARGKARPFGVPVSLRAVTSQALLRWLAVLPILWFAAFTWQFMLKAVGHAPNLQEAIRLFLATDDVRSRIQFVIFAVVLAPVAEEALFRGLLLPMLVRRTGAAAGVALTAVGFGALHGDVGTFVPLAIFSVALSLAYARTGTLRVSILMHALFNAVNLALMLGLVRAGVL